MKLHPGHSLPDLCNLKPYTGLSCLFFKCFNIFCTTIVALLSTSQFMQFNFEIYSRMCFFFKTKQWL